ncbi:MAG: immune inhibitor A [Kangiellaceae bacterium]|nr:immune inhibitor A [Kangiellaceae bacterium]
MNNNFKKSLLLASLFATGFVANAKDVNYQSAPKDIALANKQQIIYWLTKNGSLPAKASLQEQEVAYQSYVNKAIKANRASHTPKVVLQTEQAHLKQSLKKDVLQKNGQNKTVKVLTVLIDFPDLKYNNNGLTASDTGMFYSNYSVSHYNDLMFSTTGYAGPSNQNLMSAYQYYQAESGGTFSFTGNTFGWVTADNNADFYGGNDPDDNDNDKNPTALIKEAVTKAVQQNNINLADYDIEDPYDLDGDGNLEEPDGLIDHVSIFHSSIGEEAGGGNLAEDAIWSHRFFVDASRNGYTIPGTNKKLFGYVIQPIDAAAGVVVHEFGHDLGLPDLYDTNGNSAGSNAAGSPVGAWSVMSGGSWVGSIPGTQPTGFSPYGKAYLQAKYGGNWVSEQSYNLEDLTNMDVDLVSAVNHSALNQIKVNLPKPTIDFYAPYSGSYQYYSDQGHLMSNSMQFAVDLPAGAAAQLAMKAHWDIELDYDYVQVLVNDTPIAGNHTKVNNQFHSTVKNFITDKSKSITGAEGALGWVDLTFDLSSYAGQNITVKIQYVTDPAVGGYGFVADDIQVTSGANAIFNDGGEDTNQVTLDGFLRVTDKRPAAEQNYWIQLRGFSDIDQGLNNSSYSPGVLVWFADFNMDDNNSSDHPGQGLVGVVDADQGVIKSGIRTASTSSQIRDAAFGRYAQKATSGDDSRLAITTFDDSNDYSFPEQPESGMILPQHGLTMEVIEQATNSATATVRLNAAPLALTADFNFDINFRTVSFNDNSAGGNPDYSYSWNFGDGSAISTQQSPSHSYASSGQYQVSLTVTDLDNTVSVIEKTVNIAEQLVATINETVNGASVSVSANITGGVNPSVAWDFGDGNTDSGSQANHNYSRTGQYTITATITSSDQQTLTVTKVVDVVVPMTASFTSSRNNLTANFSSQVAGGDGSYSYEWNFGDQATSTAANPNHTYSAAGTYTVTLKVTDGTGVEQTASASVTVTEPPKSNSGGGGSLSLLGLLLLALFGVGRRKL